MRISDWSSDVCSSDLLGDLPFSVEGLDTLFIDGRVVAVVDGLDLEDMPEESISLLKSGKASVKAIPVGKRHDLHRDAICSAAVRVAIEFMACLTIEAVEVGLGMGQVCIPVPNANRVCGLRLEIHNQKRQRHH